MNPAAKRVSRALMPLADFLYPPRCPLCSEALASQTGLCLECWSALEFLDRGDPQVLAAVRYNDTARALVVALKHGRRTALAPVLARMMAGRIGAADDIEVIVPVPLHRWRLWRRGFNQSALIGRHLARALGVPLAVDALVRPRATPMLGELGRAERARVLEGAIAPHPRRSASVAGRRVLLVDDVMTSGATAAAAIAALHQAGASAVQLACFARVDLPR